MAASVVWLLAGCESDAARPSGDGTVPVGSATRAAAAAAEQPSATTSAHDAAAAASDGSEASAEPVPLPAGASATAGGAPPEGSAPVVAGAKRTDTRYQVWLQSGGAYHVGKPATVQAVLEAKGRYHCNERYPYKLELDAPPDGVSYPAPIARGISAGKLRRVLSVPFTPSSAGNKTIAGTFFFSVCDASTCKLGKEHLSVTVAVSE